MAKNNKSKKTKAVVIIFIIAVIAAAGVFLFINSKNTNEEAASNPSSEAISDSQIRTAESTSPQQNQNDAAEGSTESTSAPTTKQAEGYMLPLTVNEALDALYEHYGNGFDINSTIEEDGLNYFAIYRNGEKYASVEVNLSTGNATETIMENGTKTNFSLV